MELVKNLTVYKDSQNVSEFKCLRTVLMNRKEVNVKIGR